MTKNILPNEILRKKRFGGELNEAEIRAFVRGVTLSATFTGSML